MGEGLYRTPEGRTAYCEPYEDVVPGDELGFMVETARLRATIMNCLSPLWEEFRARRTDGARFVARCGLHAVWLYGDGYAREHVTFGIDCSAAHADPDALRPLAEAHLDARAEAFFDRLEELYPLRVATSPWTSTPRFPRAGRKAA